MAAVVVGLHVVGFALALRTRHAPAPGPRLGRRLRRRDRDHRLHARAAPRLRRRPHRRDRQHDPQADDRRPAPARASASSSPSGTRRSSSLLAVAVRARRQGPRGAVGDDGSCAAPGDRPDRPDRLRHLPVRDRDPQPARADLDRRRSSGGCASGRYNEAELEHQLEQPRLHEPLLRAGDRRGHASRGRCIRSGCCSGSASTPRPRSRCSPPPATAARRRAAVVRDPLPADPVRRRHVAARHDRRRVHELRLRLGVLQAGPQGLLQHHDHLAVRRRRAGDRHDRADVGARREAQPHRPAVGPRRRPRPQLRRLRDRRRCSSSPGRRARGLALRPRRGEVVGGDG